jgi:hypothetical protein
MFKEVDCQMEARAGIAIALFLVGCTQPQVSDGNSEPIVAVAPTVAPRPAPQQRETPRRLKLQLTLDRPEDLKVKEQEQVVKGQVLSDRPSARTQLEQQRQAIRLKLEHLNAAGSSPVSNVVERAKVRQAQVRVQQARAAIAQFKTHSPWTNYAWASLPLDKELAQVTQLEGKVRETEAELELAVAQLQAVREKQSVSQDKSLQRMLLLSQLQDVEAQVDEVGVVRSPYAGTVKKIKWLGQVNQELLLELTVSPTNMPIAHPKAVP